MVIYSIYPPEIVLGQTEVSQPHYFTVEMDGKSFVLEMVDGQARIVRLLSTNPRDYMEPKYQPGTTFGFVSPPQTSL